MGKCRSCGVYVNGYAKMCGSCKEARRRFCIDCGAELSGHGRPVRCRSCTSKKHMHEGLMDRLRTPDALAKRSATMKKTCADLEYRANMSRLRRIDWFEGKFDHIDWGDIARGTWDGNDVARQRLSDSLKTYYKMHPDARRRNSEAKKAAHARGCYDGNSEKMKAAHARGCFDHCYFSPSKLELRVLDAFLEFDVEADSQYRIEGHPYVYDIYLPEYQTLVEVDGEYWHYSRHAMEKGVPERDAEKDEVALSNGYAMVRIPEVVLDERGAEQVVETVIQRLTMA